MDRAPRKHLIKAFEEFDYSDFYDDVSISTVTTGPNVTEYEVRQQEERQHELSFMCAHVFTSSHLSLCMFVGQIVEYEDYDNTTDFYHVNEYEYEEEYDERYGPAEREREFSLNAQVPSKLSHS